MAPAGNGSAPRNIGRERWAGRRSAGARIRTTCAGPGPSPLPRRRRNSRGSVRLVHRSRLRRRRMSAKIRKRGRAACPARGRLAAAQPGREAGEMSSRLAKRVVEVSRSSPRGHERPLPAPRIARRGEPAHPSRRRLRRPRSEPDPTASALLPTDTPAAMPTSSPSPLPSAVRPRRLSPTPVPSAAGARRRQRSSIGGHDLPVRLCDRADRRRQPVRPQSGRPRLSALDGKLDVRARHRDPDLT